MGPLNRLGLHLCQLSFLSRHSRPSPRHEALVMEANCSSSPLLRKYRLLFTLAPASRCFSLKQSRVETELNAEQLIRTGVLNHLHQLDSPALKFPVKIFSLSNPYLPGVPYHVFSGSIAELAPNQQISPFVTFRKVPNGHYQNRRR